MPLDVLGCTRATLICATSIRLVLVRFGNLFKTNRDMDRFMHLLIVNKEFLVDWNQQLLSITSLLFVHIARLAYRLSDPVNNSDCSSVQFLSVVAESLMNLIT